jgi:hypothetical protein
MFAVFSGFVAERKRVFIPCRRGDIGENYPLRYGHSFKIYGVVLLENRVDPVYVTKGIWFIIVGGLPEIDK